MKVVLNSSCSQDNDYIRKAPISGKASILEDSIMPGVWTKTISTAIIDGDENCGGGGEPGQTCSQYGAGGSGQGVIIQKTIAKDGGGNAVPYKQEILTITGVML